MSGHHTHHSHQAPSQSTQPHTLMENVSSGVYMPQSTVNQARDEYSDFYSTEAYKGLAPPWYSTSDREVCAKLSWYQEAEQHTRTFIQGVRYFCQVHTFIMVAATAIATLLCSKSFFDISIHTSFSIFTFGTVFPLTFAMKANFENRERALSALAKFKANIFALMMFVQTWDVKGASDDRASVPADELRPLCLSILRNVEMYCRFDDPDKDPALLCDHAVYDDFSKVASFLEKSSTGTSFGLAEVAKGGEGGKSRLWQFLHDSLSDWEEVKTVRCYRSPKGLKRFCYLLIHLCPVGLAPYWNHFCSKEHDGQYAHDLGVVDPQYGCLSGYFVGGLFSAILMTLYRVLEDLEDPFDGEGDDDVKWEAWTQQNQDIARFGPGGPELRERMEIFVRGADKVKKK